MSALPDEALLAEIIAEAVQVAVGPLVTRLTKAEQEAAAAHALVDAWRDRVVVLEAKAHAPLDLTPLYERVAVLETKAPLPGPPGPVGPAGSNGADGNRWRGVFKKDVTRGEPGDWVTFKNSLWYCHEPTTSDPGTSKAWQLMNRPIED